MEKAPQKSHWHSMAAKRRRYPLLNEQQLQDHLEMFALDWEQVLINLGWSSDGTDAPANLGWTEQYQQLKRWLDNYMRPYKDRDRQRLCGTVLNQLFAEFNQISEDRDPHELFEWIAGWLIEAVTLYAMFKPFLSPEQVLAYASPLRECYSIFQSQAPDFFDPDVHQMVNTLCNAHLKAG